MFTAGVLSPYEYLILYPLDAEFNNKFILERLINLIKPCEPTINEKIQYILQLHKKLHKEPDIRPVIFSI